MSNAAPDTYAKVLSGLEGDEFQDAVSALLERSLRGFQPVPDKPQGDGGLDGFSHGGAVAYCCYGPEYSAAKTPRERVKAIVTKFAEDMRKLFELDTSGTNLIHSDNVELPKILPESQKILEIKLIVNWFADHQVLSPLHSLLPRYVSVSRCRFVDRSVTMCIWGPKELVNAYPVDEAALAGIQHKGMFDRVQNRAKGLALTFPQDFDAKMTALRGMRPRSVAAISTLEQNLRENWRTNLAFENELDATVPGLRRCFENARTQIASSVSSIMISCAEGSVELERCRTVAVEILDRDFSTQYGELVPAVADGEIARLIGECPIEWRKVDGGNASTAS